MQIWLICTTEVEEIKWKRCIYGQTHLQTDEAWIRFFYYSSLYRPGTEKSVRESFPKLFATYQVFYTKKKTMFENVVTCTSHWVLKGYTYVILRIVSNKSYSDRQGLYKHALYFQFQQTFSVYISHHYFRKSTELPVPCNIKSIHTMKINKEEHLVSLISRQNLIPELVKHRIYRIHIYVYP